MYAIRSENRVRQYIIIVLAQNQHRYIIILLHICFINDSHALNYTVQRLLFHITLYCRSGMIIIINTTEYKFIHRVSRLEFGMKKGRYVIYG